MTDIKKIKGLNLAQLKNLKEGSILVLAWLVLFCMLGWEGWVIKNSVGMIFAKASVQEPSASAKAVKIDFDSYQKVINRIQQAPNYQPADVSSSSPFGALAH